MQRTYRDFDGLSYREIRYRLTREGLPEDLIESTILNIRQDRSTRANTKRQTKEHNKRWGEVIASLQHERRIVRGMLRYKTKTPAPERDEFVEQYFAALTRLYERLRSLKALNRKLPEHSHWTDYVPDKVKNAFIDAAGGVPARDRAKMKEPFQRTDPFELATLRRGRLLRLVRSTLESVLQRLDANPDDESAIRKEELLREALRRINALPDNAHVPNHWAELMRDKLRPEDDIADTTPATKKRTVRHKRSEKTVLVEQAVRETAQHFNKLMVQQTLNTTLAKFIKKIEGDDK